MTASDAVPETFVPDRPTITAAVQLAGRAPSVHNTQPWRWVFDGTRLHLHRDNDRLLISADPHGRQLVISCGAVLHHVRTAFAAHGWHTDTVRLPDPEQRDLLASVEFRPWADPPAGVAARAHAIDLRHTDRLPMLPPNNWPELVHTARMLANPHDIELDALDAEAGVRLAAASQHATALRRYDMEYQAELHWWTGHSPAPEGIPRTALVSDAEFSRVPVGRTFPSAPHSTRRSEFEDQAQLLVLSSANDSMLDWLRTGEALSAVLLECTAAGQASCALTHITELPTARKTITGLLPHHTMPQVVIRVGTAPDGEVPPESLRRPVTDILSFRQG
ncbi:Acg family FMN-binding oxidoreductase [Nocardia sp. NPDC049149]|uniref:Acg family FMN-binding oxidoreductase n=1 Tax=Nocardia sp. NPDC049149 TaxID=3364315 RepID=UPI0037137F4D